MMALDSAREWAEERLIRLAGERLGFERSRLFMGRIGDALGAACQSLGGASPERAIDLLAGLPLHAEPWQAAIAHLTVNETRFHRDRAWFAALEKHVLAPLVASRATNGARAVTIWSAGCATGEEPYTLAMLVDRLAPAGEEWAIRILATDINARNLASARLGIFSRWALREIDPELRARYFTPASQGPAPHGAGKQHRIAPRIGGMVDFRPLNLVEPLYPDAAGGISGFDVILCRNTLMYWTAEQQQAAVARLRRSLAPGGWLIVSAAEAGIAELDRLERVRLDGAIFFRNRPEGEAPPAKLANRPLPLPASRPAVPALRPVQAKPMVPRRADPAPPAGYSQARSLADGGKLDQARRACMAILEKDALDLGANLLLAMICEEQGDFGAALAAARRAIYLAPASPLGHFLAGTAAHRMGRSEDAGRSMRAVLGALNGAEGHAPANPGLELSDAEMRRTALSVLGLSVPGLSESGHGAQG